MLVGVFAAGSASAAKPGPPVIKNKSEVEVQVLAINDFHGNLEPPTGAAAGSAPAAVAGGAEYLATHIAPPRATQPATRSSCPPAT